ncbi:diguanylate cyclase domain-containing protein [Agathobaculum sp.]|uniref:diguanylate cyclase domain-containing protein n=1 Tax=Agathobaculum sp. TaxID=2048138 RepID=UPI003AB12F02
MKNRTLRRAAETLVLLLIAAMAVFLAAGLHQRAPDEALTTLSTGWYQLTDGVRRDVTLPATLPAEPGQTITLYNDTLTDSDGGKVLSARGVEYDIEIRAGETLLYRYEDNAFPKNAQMKGRLWADTELPDNIGGQTLSLTLTPLSGRAVALAAPVLGTAPAVTGHHIQSSLFSIGMMLAMLVLAVLALMIFFYMSFFGIRERRFLDVAVFLLLCSLWCLTDSGLYQIYGRDTAAGSIISFYAFMTMPIPMVHFVRNTVSGRLRLVPDVCIALFCANALAQGAAYRLLGVPFIAMLPLTHLLLTAGVAAMLTALLRSYRDKPAPQLRLRIAAFAALGAFGVAALVLYWLLHIYWYDAVYQFGVLLFIILLLYGLIGQAAGDMRFHMEHRISHEMQREDRMTGLPNRRAFEEYMERIRTGRAGCRDAVLTYIRLEGLNERNDRFGLQAGDESVIAAAQCVADFCRACEEAGESVLCFRTGGNEFALIRPEPHTDSGQLHRQFRAVVARYNRTCAPRARIIMTFGFSRLCDEDGKSRSISAWKAEADAHLKRNEAGLGGDAE